jgi:uncharacterized membrane protein YciS (DUF1049 family)
MKEKNRSKLPQDLMAQRMLSIQTWQLIVCIIGIIIMVATLYLTYLSLKQSYIRIEKNVQRIEKDVRASAFKIMSPEEGQAVSMIEVVRGKTPFLDMNNYLVVVPVKTGDLFVQPGPLQVSPGGFWTGRVTLGSAGVGSGQEFLIYAISTKGTLPAGPLAKLPVDAVTSDSVKVIRQQ